MREVNNLAVDWCGYTREQVLDRPFWEAPWWRGSDEVKARIRFATHLAALGAVFREELRYWVADGSERIVDFAMHPIRDQSGAVLFLHKAAFTFVSERGAPFTVAGLGKLIERVGIASAAIELNRGQLASLARCGRLLAQTNTGVFGIYQPSPHAGRAGGGLAHKKGPTLKYLGPQ